MTIENAVKALAKHTTVEQDGRHYVGRIGNYVVGFIRNGGENGGAVCIGVRGASPTSDWTWFPSLKSAINSALRSCGRA
jgi:hypothetical protein